MPWIKRKIHVVHPKPLCVLEYAFDHPGAINWNADRIIESLHKKQLLLIFVEPYFKQTSSNNSTVSFEIGQGKLSFTKSRQQSPIFVLTCALDASHTRQHRVKPHRHHICGILRLAVFDWFQRVSLGRPRLEE